MEKNINIKKQLIKSVNAIKFKVKQIKDDEFNAKNHLNYFFKPVAGPLSTLLATNLPIPHASYKDLPIFQKIEPSKSHMKKSDSDSKLNTSEQFYSDYDSINDDGDDNEDDNDYDARKEDEKPSTEDKSLSKEEILEIYDDMNIPFGVRNVNNRLMIGNKDVEFFTSQDNSDDKCSVISIDDKRYELTPGLKELLLRKRPNLNIISNHDKLIYKNIIELTNVHKRDYLSSAQIKGDKGIKYRKIIKPLIESSSMHDLENENDKMQQGAGLPTLKKYCKNTELVYWDDPNELVERLKLLIASKTAGNTSLDNEIISIIEELQEIGIVKL